MYGKRRSRALNSSLNFGKKVEVKIKLMIEELSQIKPNLTPD